MTVADLSEAELVARIQSRLPEPPEWVHIGIGDDAAVVEAGRNRLEVLTTDSLIEGIHFDRAFMSPRSIGHRALAVNLSDLAAMGAEPRLALLSMGLPAGLGAGEFDELIGGLAALAARYHLAVIGGNLARSPGPLILDVTVMGTVKPRRVLTRAGARPGDELYVTGTVGIAGAGVQLLRAGNRGIDTGQMGSGGVRTSRGVRNGRLSASALTCLHRFLFPEPRIRAGLLLARNKAAAACLDLSDGLGAGLHTLAAASSVGVLIDEASLPLGGALEAFAGADDPVAEALDAGDDYELLFAVRPRFRGRLKAVASAAGVVLTKIGTCTTERHVLLRRVTDGVETCRPVPGGFGHFGRAS